MSDRPIEATNDPTYQKYTLKCRTKFFDKTVVEKHATYERRMVILIPEENDEMYRFLRAWCPSEINEKHELAANLGAPVRSPARCAVFMGHDEKCDRPYLFVMSKACEDILVKYKEGTVLLVTTLPADEDSEADNAETSEGNYVV